MNKELDIRDLKCGECGQILGTLGFPEGTPNREYERVNSKHLCEDCAPIDELNRSESQGLISKEKADEEREPLLEKKKEKIKRIKGT